MKQVYPFQVFDLRFQNDHIKPNKIQLLKIIELILILRLFALLVRHREFEMVSDGKKNNESQVN